MARAARPFKRIAGRLDPDRTRRFGGGAKPPPQVGLPLSSPNTAGQNSGTALHAFYRQCIERWSKPRYALDSRFVDLSLLLDQGEEAQGPRWQSGKKFGSLQELLSETTEPLVILGNPGCGKSTLLRHYELDNARHALTELEQDPQAKPPLTFFIQLNDFKSERPSDPAPLPMVWLSERWARQHPELPALSALIASERITLLLDALNEMPHRGLDAIRLWKDFLAGLDALPSGTRVVFSCRSLDYSAPLSSKDRPVPQARIEALSDGKVRDFLLQYSPAHGAALWRNLSRSAQLTLFRSPYFLKMLIDESVDGNIPGGRAALFTAFVRRLLIREIENDHNALFQAGELLHERDIQQLICLNNGGADCRLPERGRLIPQLARLAYRVQTQSGSDEAGLVKIDYDLALAILGEPDAEQILRAGIEINVLEQDLWQDRVYYAHQLLQEYFAARHFANAPDYGLASQAWQADEVTPALAETLSSLADSDPLPPLPATGWEETLMLAAAMAADADAFIRELTDANLVLAGRCAAQPDVRLSDRLKAQLQTALAARSQHPNVDLRARIAAGFALGELGDPRLPRSQGPDAAFILPPLIAIPGGVYTIGSNEGFEDESPPHPVTLNEFGIGRCPVTNAEWRLFIEAGAYDDERWWRTDAAKAWRRGENTDHGPKQQWREFRKSLRDQFAKIREWLAQGRITSKQAENWETVAEWSDEVFEAWLTEQFPGGRLTEPAYWNNELFNRAAQPVVGICLYEAQAYCCWLSAQSGLAMRLPSEAEWEATARGRKARRHAYGDRFDPGKANTFETHIRAATPVGVFPGGNTPEGLQDVCGNAWEWTGSLYRAHPYQANDGHENADNDGRRVLRGGSWYDNQVNARAASRLNFAPGDRDLNLGFRLVCSSPIVRNTEH